MANEKIELTDYQKDLLKKLEGSGLRVSVTDHPIGTGKSDIMKKHRLLELAESGGERPETSEAKKQRMLELAANGATKPVNSEKLGLALRRYCSHSCYDANFHNKLRALRPDWFTADGALLPMVPTSTIETKEELLKMAESGKPRPSSNVLIRCMNDPMPDKTAEEREDIYHYAGAEQRLGRALINYTNKSRKTYDADFDAKIRALRPDWFN